MSIPIEVFCCYAREDQKMLEHLKKHLVPLQRRGQIQIWSDTNLGAGVEWKKELDQHLENADIILLLISPNFMNSDYCYSTEMKRAIERHDQGNTVVIPILLSSILWENAPFAKIQMVPTDAKPVTNWIDRDDAFHDVASHIDQVVSRLQSQHSPIEADKPSNTEYTRELPPPFSQNLSARKKRFLSIAVGILITVLFLGIGSFALIHFDQPSVISSSVSSNQTAQESPVVQSTDGVSVTKAMSYYDQYITNSPKQVVTPSQNNDWFSGSPAYGMCTDKGTQGYHATTLLSIDTSICLAPSPYLYGDYALQSALTVQQGGVGAGLAFGFVPVSSLDANYNGNFYYFGYCGVSGYGCSAGNFFLDHLENGQHAQCMGPGPDAKYSTGSAACNDTSNVIQGVTNTLTVIVLHGTVYLYMNKTFVFEFTPHPPVSYSTGGQIGFIAISGDVTCQQIKIWTF